MPSSRSGDADARRAVRVLAVVQGLLLAFAVALAGFALLGAVTSLSGWDEPPSGTQVFHYVSMGVGGLYAARRAQRAGWLHGGLVGLSYAVLVAALAGGGNPAILQSLGQPAGLLRLALAFLAGAAGGMLGVNF